MPRPQPPRKQPQQARSHDLVAAIVEAAARVFDERGYDATTTNHVAEVAGVSVGSVYQYFADKQALITALHERHAAQVLAVLDDARQQAPGRALTASIQHVVRGLLSLHRLQPTLQRILHDEHVSLQYGKSDSPLGREIVQRTHELLATYPELQLENMQVTVHLLVRTIEELVHAAVLDPPESASNDEVERAIVRATDAFLAPRSAGL
jgi:AcrR family transcriptional regulator